MSESSGIITTRIRPMTIAIVAYGVTLASMATVGVIVPLMAQMTLTLNASMAELGLTIGLFSLPAALLSIISGGLVDRLGPKLTILLSGLFAIAADIMVFQARSLPIVQIAMVLAGIANTGIITAVPALLMNALAGDERIRAMSLWSTYGPAGYAVGLLLCAPFAGTAHWDVALIVLTAAMLVTTIAAMIVLPDTRRRAAVQANPSIAQMFSILRDLPLVRICLAYGLAASISYGSSLAAPGYLSKIYGVSIASSAAAVAAAKIVAMLLGGVGMGWLLSRWNDRVTIFAIVATFGLGAQILLYFPGSGMIVATSAMILWLFAYGGIAATSFVMLAQVNRDPARSGVASGMIGQIASVGCFLAPTVYFAIEAWLAYVAVAGVGLLLAFLVFPRIAAPAR